MSSEQERALLYRTEAQAREDARLARERALAGNPSARQALDAEWEPLGPWAGWDPVVKVREEEESWSS